MSLDTLKEMIPDYAKDLKINLSNIAATASLTPQQLWGTVLASALAAGNADVIRHAAAAAAAHLSPEAVNAAKSAMAIMGMNNIYYRFTHLVGNEHYASMPARLRMNVIGAPGVEKVDFELWSLAVSAVEGCGRCIEAHEKVLVPARHQPRGDPGLGAHRRHPERRCRHPDSGGRPVRRVRANKRFCRRVKFIIE